MSAEQRRDVRYRSSQPAVLLSEAGAGNLGIITNLSNGGLCLAVVGSSRSYQRQPLSVKIRKETFQCDVVNIKNNMIHCRLNERSRVTTLFEMVKRDHPPQLAASVPAEAGRASLENHHDKTYDKSGRWREESGGSPSVTRDLTLRMIYAEGCQVGMDHVDPGGEFLEAVITVLNPYSSPDERAHWALGFKDAIFHLTRQGRFYIRR